MSIQPFQPKFMKVGVLTAALQELTPREVRDPDPDRAIEEWLEFAHELGVDYVQLSAALHPTETDVPPEAMLDPVANTLDLRKPFDKNRATRVRAALGSSKVGISEIGYFDNMLHHDAAVRQKKHDFMHRVFESASLLGVNAVCGFVGRNQQHSMDENLIDFEQQFVPLLKEAKTRGLVYRVEQCPMPGWTTGDNFHNNIAYTPGTWIALHRICEKHGVGDQFRIHYDPSHAILMGQDTRSIFQYLKDTGYDFLIGGFHVKGQVIDPKGVAAWGYGGQTVERGDWKDGRPSPNPADQVNAWKKQVVLCEHELPGTARHDPLAYLQNRTVDWLDHQLAARELLKLDVANTHLVVEHEYPKARIQDRARLKPILQGSIAFVRRIDEAAACMYALQHEVLKAQDIPIQGVGRQAYRSSETDIPVLGIDIGTGGSRAVLVGDDGAVIGAATSEHAPFASPGPAWAEQDPTDWWRAAQQAVRDALKRTGVAPAKIAAVGLSGQMHGAVMLDERHQVVRPALIWCDQRTDEQCEWLNEKIGRSRLLELTSNPALPNFTLTKLLWVRQHEPDAWKRVRQVMLPKDYVRLRLSGEHAIDVADASGTLMLDVAKRRWSPEMLDAAGIQAAWLPKVFESPEVCARVSKDAASTTGIPEGTPIVAGAGDQAAGAVGMGITRPGAVSATIGTSGVVFAATDRPALDPKGRLHTFCHAIPGRWHVMGVTQAAGLSLRWLRDQWTYGEASDPVSYEELTMEAATAPAGSDGVLWAPYLMGERTPHLDSRIRAGLVGLTASHTRAHVIRAVLEGVAFSLKDTFTIFSELGVPVNRIRLGGGGARSPLWAEIQAGAYGHAVETVTAEEGAAYGAALLAGVGAGIWPDVDAACDAGVHTAHVVQPPAAAVDVMNRRYSEYRRVYPALRGIYV